MAERGGELLQLLSGGRLRSRPQRRRRAQRLDLAGQHEPERNGRPRIEDLDLIVRTRVREVDVRRPALVLKGNPAARDVERSKALALRRRANRPERVSLRIRPYGEVVRLRAADRRADGEVADVHASVFRVAELIG